MDHPRPIYECVWIRIARQLPGGVSAGLVYLFEPGRVSNGSNGPAFPF
jgi:hypothetical protein